MSEQPLGPAGSLVADIIQANVDSLARTTDRIQANLQAQLAALAQAYLDLYDHVAREEYMSRSLHTYLDLVSLTQVPIAERIVNRGDN